MRKQLYTENNNLVIAIYNGYYIWEAIILILRLQFKSEYYTSVSFKYHLHVTIVPSSDCTNDPIMSWCSLLKNCNTITTRFLVIKNATTPRQ